MLTDRIVFIEGVDASGKTGLAKRIAENYGLDFIDNEYLREFFPDFSGKDWRLLVAGMNLQQAQFARSSAGFVKTRYSLTEAVYSRYYNRSSVITPYLMEASIVDKAIVILVDLSYERYLKNMASRSEEAAMSEQEFTQQRQYFEDAYRWSYITTKTILSNDGEFNNLVESAYDYLDSV